MKVGIWDGCANGGMMDSLNISLLRGDDNDGEPYFTAEVTPEQWQAWQDFLVLHDSWEGFWNKFTHEPMYKGK